MITPSLMAADAFAAGTSGGDELTLTTTVVIVGTLAAAVFGLSKTAIPAVGSFGAALLTLVLPALPSAGVALPVLVVGYLFALGFYARSANTRVLVRMIPAVTVGIAAGFAAVELVDHSFAARLIGALLVVSGAGEIWRRWAAGRREETPEVAGDFGPVSLTLGVGAGFSTMVANAGGPMMTVYLLRLGVTARAFLGTQAWFFFTVNMIKMPFSVGLGLINPHSLTISAALLPGVVAGALLGRRLVLGMSQTVFENVALAATTLAGLWLLTG